MPVGTELASLQPGGGGGSALEAPSRKVPTEKGRFSVSPSCPFGFFRNLSTTRLLSLLLSTIQLCPAELLP